MKKVAFVLIGISIFAVPGSATELVLVNPVQATALENPTCLHVEPDAESELLVCFQEGATVTLVGRLPEKAEVEDVEDYWWKVELPDGSYAWVFGTQIQIEKPESK